MSPAKKKKKTVQVEKPEVVVVTNQPISVSTMTVKQAESRANIWTALAAVRQSLWYGFWIGVGLMPIGSHIVSQFYCGHGENLRCQPIEFPAWMEAGGIIVALIFANAAKDVVSKSAKQLAEAAKGWLPWTKASSPSPPDP